MYEELKQVWSELTGPGAPFEITEIEVRGQRLRSYAGGPPSLREFWLGSAAHADQDYLVYEDERWTYAQGHRDVSAIAAWLAAQGVEPGDRVAIAMRNYPEWMLCYWAIVSMGATVVGVNAWWVTAELRYAVKDSQPKVMICDAERLERFLPAAGDVPPVQLVGVRIPALPDGVVPWSKVLATAGALPEVEVDPDADACIFYTSGTTGRPKGAQLTHRGCIANVLSLGFWATAQSLAVKRHRGDTGGGGGAPPRPSTLLGTPLFHVTANNCSAMAATATGGKLVHMYKWDAGEALRLIEREKVTNISAVPVMSRELIMHPDFAKHDTSSLRVLGGGGAPMQPDLVDKIEKSAPERRPQTGYGMTETCGIITANTAEFFVDKPGSAGPAMPCFEARCVDEAGNDVPAGDPGELWVRGSQVIKGYLNRPDATAETITDGWLHTGDIARIDEDGFVFLVDRAKDMVLRGGENIYCSEVEATIFEQEGIVECAAFAVPDDKLGEEVGVAVVLTAPGATSAEHIRTHCATRLAKFKVPRYLWLRTEALPRNANGKFVKRELRDSLSVTDAE